MRRRILALVILSAISASTYGRVIVEVVPTTDGPYVPGQRVVLEVFLSQAFGVGDIPIRLLQLDFTDTSPELILDSRFVFDYSAQAACRADAALCGSQHAEFPSLIDAVRLISTVFAGDHEDLGQQIILPRSGAIQVGSVGVTLPSSPGTYQLDVVNADAEDPLNQGAAIHFDFQSPTAWHVGEFEQVGGPYFVSDDSGGAFTVETSRPASGCSSDSACDDGEPCTLDRCNNGICVHFPRFALCDDGDICTVNDRCLNGECVGQPNAGCCHGVADCDDENEMTVDSCVAYVCVHQRMENPSDNTAPTTSDDPVVVDGPPQDPVVDPDNDNAPADEPAGQPVPDDGLDGSEDDQSGTTSSRRGGLCGAIGMVGWSVVFVALALARFSRARKNPNAMV